MTKRIPIEALHNPEEISDLCRREKEPVIITEDDKDSLVIMSEQAFAENREMLKIYQSLARSEEQIQAGMKLDARRQLNLLRNDYNL